METGRDTPEDEPRRLVSQALDTVRAVRKLSPSERAALVAAVHGLGKSAPELSDDTAEPSERARKISVSMPENLSTAVRRRVGRGEFSRYVSEAVASRLEADLLAELIELLEEEHGEVPEDLVTEAEAAWPDTE